MSSKPNHPCTMQLGMNGVEFRACQAHRADEDHGAFENHGACEEHRACEDCRACEELRECENDRACHLGEEVWQAVIGVLHVIKLVTNAI